MAQIEKAVAHLKAQDEPNILAASKLFKVEYSTLWRRYRGKTQSREDAAADHRQLLNKHQEEVLLGYIDRMTARHIPPTPQIVENLVSELIGRAPGKNWAATFVRRHKERICSRYLNPLDRSRCSVEKPALFQQFYDAVYAFFRGFVDAG